MKILEKTFTMNADKCGNHTFTQVRRDGNVCCYRRDRVTDGTLHSFEVFATKVIKAGSSMRGGGIVQEDYEQYPGKSAFGRWAWTTNHPKAADKLFNDLVAKKLAIVAAEEDDDDETELVTVARVTQPKGDRRSLKWPEGPFTQKQLAVHNNIGNYKEVYTDLQRALGNGTLKVSEQVHEVNRGRAAKMFEVVNVAQPVAA